MVVDTNTPQTCAVVFPQLSPPPSGQILPIDIVTCHENKTSFREVHVGDKKPSTHYCTY